MQYYLKELMLVLEKMLKIFLIFTICSNKLLVEMTVCIYRCPSKTLGLYILRTDRDIQIL